MERKRRRRAVPIRAVRASASRPPVLVRGSGRVDRRWMSKRFVKGVGRPSPALSTFRRLPSSPSTKGGGDQSISSSTSAHLCAKGATPPGRPNARHEDQFDLVCALTLTPQFTAVASRRHRRKPSRRHSRASPCRGVEKKNIRKNDERPPRAGNAPRLLMCMRAAAGTSRAVCCPAHAVSVRFGRLWGGAPKGAVRDAGARAVRRGSIAKDENKE